MGVETGTSEPAGGALAVLVLNLPFVATSMLATVGLTVFDRPSVLSAPYVAGVAVVALTVAVTLVVPWHRVPRRTEIVVAVLDLLAVALFVGADTPLSLLAVFPVLWLAQRHGRAGVTTGVVGAFAVTWLPTALVGGVSTSSQVARVALVPVVLAAVALSVGAIQRRSDARNLLLRRQGVQLRGAAQDLAAERRLLDAVVGTAGVGIVLLDDAGRVVLANRLAVEASGGSLRPGVLQSDLPPARPTTLDGTPFELGAIDRAVAGEEIRGEVGWWHLPGGRFALRTSAVRLDGSVGEQVGRLTLVTFEDLTEQVAAIELKEDFVAAASHELRTPLTSIVGHLELAADDPSTPDGVARHLDVATRNADRLLALVDDLLTAAVTGTGDLPLERVQLDLAEVVAEAVVAITPLATSADLRLVLQDAGPVRVRGDRARLRQVVDNLLSNAVKYSDAGGTVEVSLAGGADHVLLVVRDDGVGIAASDVDRVFTRFYRAAAVRHGSRHGTGLGLHLCQQVVHAHGGTIELTSEAGVGTAVEVRLPAAGTGR
ncbi:HAMP domain-containing histidine kinase [Cellulosimicrobium terreum]|nr:HAMP domain-containing histidine kinase [Cellulosimicrobium terreum]